MYDASVYWPDWWQYEVVISPHALKRMNERGLTETDLRAMLEDASAYRDAAAPGRFIIATTIGAEDWEVIVELDELDQILIIVTAYWIES